MHDRIKELAERAGYKHPNAVGMCEDYAYFSLENFAELIVRECVEILDKNNPCPAGTIKMYSLIQDEYFDKGWQVAAETKSNQIQKHFGVEE